MKQAKRWRRSAKGDHRAVLKAYRDRALDYPDSFFGFRSLCGDTGFDYKKVRRISRLLRREGLLEYECGLFDPDGRVAGSGYRITKRGQTLLEIGEG